MRPAALVVVASVAVATAVVLTQEPEDLWAIALLIAAIAGAFGGLAAAVQLRGVRRRRGPGAARRAAAVRRAALVAVAVALLLWLRVVDGLSITTASFVVGTFLVAELVLSARPASSR